jgi:hypothetical protein
MIKKFRVTVENIDHDDDSIGYVVEEKQKDFLVETLSGYKVTVEEFFVDNDSEL